MLCLYYKRKNNRKFCLKLYVLLIPERERERKRKRERERERERAKERERE